jgi:hypothetical protein
MTDDEIKERLGFDKPYDAARTHYSGTRPFSITKSTRGGRITFETTDMRTGKSVKVANKREATHVAKLIEQDWYESSPKTQHGFRF